MSDPATHPDWWPDVLDVQVSETLGATGEYVRVSRRAGFLTEVDAIWIAERLEHLHEARFTCSVSGTYARFALTPAQDDTFLEIETGMLPPTLRWRVTRAFSRSYFKRWLRDVLDALPRELARSGKRH